MNKLRDQLGVKVDLSDDVDEKEKEGGKKRKAVHQKSKVKVSVCGVIFDSRLINCLLCIDYRPKGKRRGGEKTGLSSTREACECPSQASCGFVVLKHLHP